MTHNQPKANRNFKLPFDSLKKSKKSCPRDSSVVTNRSASTSSNTHTVKLRWPNTLAIGGTCLAWTIHWGRVSLLPGWLSPQPGSLPKAGEPVAKLLDWTLELQLGSAWLDPSYRAGTSIILNLYLVAKPKLLPYSKLLYLLCCCLWHVKHLQLPPWSCRVNTAVHTVHF